MKFIIVLCLSLLILSCSDEKKLYSTKNILYKNENITILKENKGLPENIKRIFLTKFFDNTILSNFFEDNNFIIKFNDKLKEKIINHNKIIINNIQLAQAIISGYISNFSISQYNITNKKSILLKIDFVYSITDKDFNFIQKDCIVKNEILCLNTNQYSKEELKNIVIDKTTQILVESIIYGWVLEGTSNKIVIGDEIETSDFTSW